METNSFLKVIRGNPTPEELAALIVVLAARVSPAAPVDSPAALPASPAEHSPSSPSSPPFPSAWADRSRSKRWPLVPGPGAWRAGAWAR
ncbi:acyl-CoA carboxylase subunit epsilon [Streptosporangium sp. NPDC000396]|uniref:acyl-CoA carboxylase subunit epsilon n=1 Tax=Streptosporangium sp. NPDC000396 TaxID=3366185 RepID=UPI0036B87928